MKAEVHETLEKATVPLQANLDALKKEIDEQSSILEKNTSKIVGNQAAIEELKEVQNILHDEINAAEIKLSETAQKNERLAKENNQIVLQIDSLNSDAAALSQTNNVLQQDIAQSEALKMRLDEDIQTLESDYEQEKATKEVSISKLDVKLLDKSQELDLIQDKERLIRTDLASWQRSLEEKDKNLRLREVKVEEGENKIVTNANLLNL